MEQGCLLHGSQEQRKEGKGGGRKGGKKERGRGNMLAIKYNPQRHTQSSLILPTGLHLLEFLSLSKSPLAMKPSVNKCTQW